MQYLHTHFAIGRSGLDGVCYETVHGHMFGFVQGGTFCAEKAFHIGSDTPSHDHGNAAPRPFRKVCGHFFVTFNTQVLQAGMHRAHHDAVLQCGIPKV